MNRLSALIIIALAVPSSVIGMSARDVALERMHDADRAFGGPHASITFSQPALRFQKPLKWKVGYSRYYAFTDVPFG